MILAESENRIVLAHIKDGWLQLTAIKQIEGTSKVIRLSTEETAKLMQMLAAELNRGS